MAAPIKSKGKNGDSVRFLHYLNHCLFTTNFAVCHCLSACHFCKEQNSYFILSMQRSNSLVSSSWGRISYVSLVCSAIIVHVIYNYRSNKTLLIDFAFSSVKRRDNGLSHQQESKMETPVLFSKTFTFCTSFL